VDGIGGGRSRPIGCLRRNGKKWWMRSEGALDAGWDRDGGSGASDGIGEGRLEGPCVSQGLEVRDGMEERDQVATDVRAFASQRARSEGWDWRQESRWQQWVTGRKGKEVRDGIGGL
jgi:hypothetical protein